MYFDRPNAATQIVVQGLNDKHYRSVQLKGVLNSNFQPFSFE